MEIKEIKLFYRKKINPLRNELLRNGVSLAKEFSNTKKRRTQILEWDPSQ